LGRGAKIGIVIAAVLILAVMAAVLMVVLKRVSV